MEDQKMLSDISGPVIATILGLVYTDVSFGNDLAWTQTFFPGRCSSTSVVLGGKMWVIGGETYYDIENDVWSSSDGVNWTQAKAAAAFTPRAGHASVVFNNKMWVIGGWTYDPETYENIRLNDVWSSSDGVNWTQATAAAAFSPRAFHTSVVFNNKMWVIGGSYDDPETSEFTNINDVWSSSDGVNWTQATATAAFSARSYHTSVVLGGKMWVIGGYGNESDLNDVWSSPDGATWTRATAAAAFFPRNGHASVVLGNKMWVIGGYGNESDLNDVWSSSNGVTWTQATAAAAFPPAHKSDERGLGRQDVGHRR